MDEQSREDVERRLIETEAVIERCLCDKTGKKKPVIRGYAALFNSDSQDLGGFVERIAPGAFDDVMKRGTDVVALYNHDPMFLLGRESAGTLRLSIDDRGLRYEIDPPESRADVIEALERGDVRHSSFAFRVKGTGERWSKTADGRQLREIRAVDGLFDVGPVLKPAYTATESFVSRRALEMARMMYAAGDFVAWDGGVGRIQYVMEEGTLGDYTSQPLEAKPGDPVVLVLKYEHEEGYWEETDEYVGKRMSELVAASGIMGEAPAFIDQMPDERTVNLRPTAGMASAAKRGLRLHEEGKSGDGLKPETVARANKIARREELTEDHVREMNAWFARHETASKSPGWDKAGEEKPGFVAWLLWGGNAGKNWSARKAASMESERSVEEPAVEERQEEEAEGQPTAGSLSPNNYALYEAVEKIAQDGEMWPQDGPDGAHYMKKSPFAGQGMKCANCVFFNSGGSCDVVSGEIEEEGVCKLWIIPEEKLSIEDPLAEQPVAEEPRSINAASVAARLKAKALESASHGRTR